MSLTTTTRTTKNKFYFAFFLLLFSIQPRTLCTWTSTTTMTKWRERKKVTKMCIHMAGVVSRSAQKWKLCHKNKQKERKKPCRRFELVFLWYGCWPRRTQNVLWCMLYVVYTESEERYYFILSRSVVEAFSVRLCEYWIDAMKLFSGKKRAANLLYHMHLAMYRLFSLPFFLWCLGTEHTHTHTRTRIEVNAT